MGSGILLQKKQELVRPLKLICNLKVPLYLTVSIVHLLRLVRVPFTEIYLIYVSRVHVSGSHRQLADSPGSIRPVLGTSWEPESRCLLPLSHKLTTFSVNHCHSHHNCPSPNLMLSSCPHVYGGLCPPLA